MDRPDSGVGPVVLYCADRELVPRLEFSVPRECRVEVRVGWPTAPSTEPLACVVALDGVEAAYVELVETLAMGAPCVGVVAAKDLRPAKGLLALHALIPSGELPDGLRRVLRDLAVRRWRLAFARLLRTSSPALGNKPRLGDALQQSLLEGGPMIAVSDLARACSCEETTLRRWWRECDLPETPGSFVAWALLIETSVRRFHRRSLQKTVVELGKSRSTLYRISQRLCSQPLGEVTPHDLLDAFRGWLLSGREGTA